MGEAAHSPDVVAPHGGEHQEVRDEHEGDGEQDHLDQPCDAKDDINCISL